MKRFFVLFVMLMLVASVANAQYLFEYANEIGIFAVENPTAESAQDDACYTGPAGQFTIYCVLTNPVNTLANRPMINVGGFEFGIGWPAGIFVTPTIHPSATNFQTPPDFLCGANIPVVGGQCTLITITVGTFSDDPGAWYLGPISDPGVQTIPGAMAITDYDDNFSLAEAFSTAGSSGDRDFSAPVFSMWDCGVVVPNQDVSFGGVKALFNE